MLRVHGDVARSGNGRKAARHDRLLDPPGDVELLAQRDRAARGPAPPACAPAPPAWLLLERDREVLEVDRLGDEVERAAIERRADVRHVAVGGDDDRLEQRDAVRSGSPSSVRPSITGMLMSVRTTSACRLPASSCRERLLAVAREDELERLVADLLAEALGDEQFEVRLVVDDEDRVGHVCQVRGTVGSRNPRSATEARSMRAAEPLSLATEV